MPGVENSKHGIGPSLNTLSHEEALVRLAAIVESSDDAIISKDLTGTITSWNRAAEQIFGYQAEEIVGKSILTIIPPELQYEEPGILQRIGAGEKIEHYETTRVRKDGEKIFVSLTISPIKDKSGKIVGASKIARDITEKRRVEEARFRLAAIVDSSDDAVVSKDLNGIITSWNKAAEKLFGHKAEEIVGKSVLTIIPPELQYQEPEILRKLRAGDRIEHFETERITKDGQRIWVSLTISPVKDPSGKIIGASKIARDISERKKVQEALILSEKLAATGRLAAAIAHEINNPLEAVTNLAYLLANDGTLNETAQTYANLLLQEVGRASDIAKQSLAFYRDSGRPDCFEVADLLNNVLSINRQRLYRRGIEVVKDYRSSAPVFGFASEVRQVFTNLVLNAMDAMPEGGSIFVRTMVHSSRTEARELSVTIADTGRGMNAEIRKRLFEPFFTTKTNHGNGLGLWVSQGIVEKHNGRIQVKSSTKPGHSGTVFRVLLPLNESEMRQRTVA